MNSSIGQAPTSLSPEASRLFRVYRTISSMLDKQGYMVSRELKEMRDDVLWEKDASA
jgi:DNA-directed RNA polymerases I, II, and III subunit RPABC1